MYEKYTGLPDTSVGGVKRTDGGSRTTSSGRSNRQTAKDVLASDIYKNRGAQAEASSYAPARAASSSRSRISSRKRKLRRRRITLTAGGLLVLALLVVAIVVIFKSCAEPPVVDIESDVYRQGVTINGIDISGMTADQARSAVTPGLDYTVANIAITLQSESFSHRITGEEMGAVSDLEELLVTALSGGANKAYYTKLTFDYQALDARIAAINDSLETGPVDASFTVTVSESGKPEFTYIDGTPGYGLEIASTEAMVRQALESNDLQAVLTPQLTTVAPAVTVDDIKAHTTLRSKFTTIYRAERYDGLPDDQAEILENRAYNINKGTDLLNKLTVRVGETVSFNEVVGDRTEERGWKLANAIIFGNQYSLEAGGGICQVSTTLYGALLRGNIEIVSRRKHSFPSDYVDKGLDATVDTGHIDLKFKNDTEYPLYIFAYITKNKSSNRKRDLTVAIYGQALPEGVTYQPRTVLIEEIPPAEPEIIYDNKKTADYDKVEVAARTGYVIDVYLDKLVNGSVDEASSVFLYRDEYAAVAERRRVGTLPVTTPTPTSTPEVKATPAPDTEDQP